MNNLYRLRFGSTVLHVKCLFGRLDRPRAPKVPHPYHSSSRKMRSNSFPASKRVRQLCIVALCTSLLGFFPPLNVIAQAPRGDAMALREHIGKGNLCLGRQQFQQAIAEYESALAIDSSSTIAKENIVLTHNNWGIYYFRQKKFDEARSEWDQALKLNPSDRNAKNNLVVLKNTLAKLGPPPAAPVATPAATPTPASPPTSPEKNSAASLQQAADKAVNDTLAPPGSQAAKVDEGPSAGVVLLTPGRQSNTPATTGTAVDAFTFSDSSSSPAHAGSQSNAGTTPGSTQNAATGATPSSTASGATIVKQTPAPTGAILLPSQILSGGANRSTAGEGTTSSAAHVNAAPSTTPSTTPNPISIPNPVPTPNSIPATNPVSVITFPASPVVPVSSSPASYSSPTPMAPNSASPGGNLESTLGALEMKVYGNTNKNMPILQRLEHLEKDTSSHTSSGSIADRIQALTKTYGL
jgi:hypothetical protein